MRKNLVWIVVLLLITSAGYSQTVLLEEHVDEDTLREKFGPNLKHYMYSCVGYGFVAGASSIAGIPLNYGSSGEFAWGLKYKSRVSDIFSWGLGVNYSVQNFSLARDSTKTYPDNVLHDKERFAFNNLGADLFARVNFDKRRGNVIGTYFDLGGYMDWVFLTKYYTKDKNASGSMSKYTETTQLGLTTTHNFNYGIVAKIGYKNIAFVAKYRLSDMFISRYGVPELPRFLFGIEIATSN